MASTQTLLDTRLLSWSWKEIRHGQLWPVSIALTLIIASIFALTALATRMEQVIVKQGKEALTADSVFVSSNPLPEKLVGLAEQQNLQVSKRVRFGTMAFSDNEMKLVTVKAVDTAFPLQGEFRLNQNGTISKHILPSQLWLDERLFAQLDVVVGDTITLGDADFVVTGKVEEEPGLSFNPFQQMPSVYIHISDVPKTGAVQLGSRVRYNLYVNGNDDQISQLKDAVVLTPSDEWRDQNTASRTNEVFKRTTQYLSLSVAIVIIMAATTLVLTCQHYVSTRQRTIAMLKSLGGSKRWVVRWLSTQVLLLLAIAAVIGVASGIGLEFLLRIPLAELLPNPLPSYGIEPYILALSTALLIAIPALGIPLLNLVNTSAMNVMQSQWTANQAKTYLWLILVPVIPMLFAYYDNLLVWIVLAGVAVLFLVLAGFSLIVTKNVAKMPLSPSYKLALSRINRSPISTGIQFGALALSLMLLAVIWLVRSDLLTDWQRTLPADAHNAFALNIAPFELENYLQALDEQALERSPAYPIIRGRLTGVNGQEPTVVDTEGEGADALRRELNFTWSDGIPSHNVLLDGEWTSTGGVSIEADIANDLGLNIGDTLSFVINSVEVQAVVNSIRQVEWRDMKPNFYFIFSPDVLESLPSTYLVSFRITSDQNNLINQLSRSYPTVSLMDIRGMAAKIQQLLSQIIWAVTILAGIGVIAGILLVFTLLRLSLSQRQQEIQLYRTLGASNKRVIRTIFAEYGIMAVVAGTIATVGAELVVAGLMHFGFELTPTLHFSLWIALPVVTFCTLILVVGSLLKRLLVPINKDFSQ
ncbi:ABC transporter permease [Vibrio sp. TRT 21S02]|uniref:ABC transporter permease n=1 Tax=Vibrio sp. TRT 21S02 TaxID=3418507 RepID=UPI003CF55E3F